jgi:putative transposase
MELIDQNRKRYAPRKKLAKFVQGHFAADRRRKVLEVARMEDDGTIDLSDGIEVTTTLRTVPAPATDVPQPHAPEPAAEQQRTPKSPPTRRKSASMSTTPAGNDDDDIASLLARNPDWKKKP